MSLLDQRFPIMGTSGRLVLADRVAGPEPSPRVLRAAVDAQTLLAELERRWTRFDPASDLNALTDDARSELPAHEHVRALIRAGAWAGRRSGGLVDMTLGAQIAQAGYDRHWAGETAPLVEALAAAPPRAAAAPHPAARWQALGVDGRAGTIRRPPGVVLDSGGLGKGLAADMVARRLAGLRFIVDIGGDLALGHGGGDLAAGRGGGDVAVGPGDGEIEPGRGGVRPHEVSVLHPLTGAVAWRLHIAGGGVATSGIHRRLWLDADGAPAHHLLDPSTGRPAWTGLLAVTAVGRSALEAEVLAKTALLCGACGARTVLAAEGGVLIHEDGAVEVIPALRRVAQRAVAAAGGGPLTARRAERTVRGANTVRGVHAASAVGVAQPAVDLMATA